jgi:hypothetical protein
MRKSGDKLNLSLREYPDKKLELNLLLKKLVIYLIANA